MIRKHVAALIPWVDISGIPGVVYPLQGPNQLSAASELEMHNMLPHSDYTAGDGIRDMSQGPTAGFLERIPMDGAPFEKFI